VTVADFERRAQAAAALERAGQQLREAEQHLADAIAGAFAADLDERTVASLAGKSREYVRARRHRD
jgi:hypothetical protein